METTRRLWRSDFPAAAIQTSNLWLSFRGHSAAAESAVQRAGRGGQLKWNSCQLMSEGLGAGRQRASTGCRNIASVKVSSLLLAEGLQYFLKASTKSLCDLQQIYCPTWIIRTFLFLYLFIYSINCKIMSSGVSKLFARTMRRFLRSNLNPQQRICAPPQGKEIWSRPASRGRSQLLWQVLTKKKYIFLKI